MEEKFFKCPSCFEKISILVDVSVEDEPQVFIEDCEVCCRPIQFQVVVEKGAIQSFSYELS